jgi:hypothetical protein
MRVVLGAGAPLITCLPLTRYLRGKVTLVAFPLLVIVTLLPIRSVVPVGRDLLEGPVVYSVHETGRPELYLHYTDRYLRILK